MGLILPNNDYDDKIQNFVPVFETNKNRRVGENLEGRHQQIIEIDGKRYLVIQELDPAQDEGEPQEEEEDEL